jgi:hypothetical protein
MKSREERVIDWIGAIGSLSTALALAFSVCSSFQREVTNRMFPGARDA